jgi:hypothetical protein
MKGICSLVNCAKKEQRQGKHALHRRHIFVIIGYIFTPSVSFLEKHGKINKNSFHNQNDHGSSNISPCKKT